ncbi:MAG TPA: hypothetical protein VFK16_07275 [Gemmatimonadaceae bacterium]|nr:hypothetical protein [Gemmatimonadaceae bacterium]
MKDAELEPQLRDAARAYHEPPALDDPTREVMWAAIDAGRMARHRHEHRWPVNPWFGLAAALVLGVGIGRFAPSIRNTPKVAASPSSLAATTGRAPIPAVYQTPTSQYLNQTAALLLALPGEARGQHADTRFVARAQNLLLTTRLLLDSPAAQDPKLHDLLGDLELVLAQVVRLPYERSPADLDLINQALEQHDVLPRLRTAAANISAD